MTDTDTVAIHAPAIADAAAVAHVPTVSARPLLARPLSDKIQSALMRAARTFTQSFLAVLTAGPVLNLNIPTVKAGGAAGLAAVLALVQRWLDDTPVPTIPIG
jgi:hypothetical protein